MSLEESETIAKELAIGMGSPRPRSGDAASDGTSSASETCAETVAVPASRDGSAGKKRKATYYHRKARRSHLFDEIESLKGEIKALQEALLVAERAVGVGHEGDALEGTDGPTRTAFYSKSIERNNLKLAGTQAMLSSYNMRVGQTPATIPLKSYVHLPVDKEKRLEIIKSIQAEKLHATYQFMAERTRGLDLSVPHRQNEQFDFPSGEIVLLGFETVHFTSGHSLRQVFDAFMFFMVNQEICMSTELGLLTIRESEEVVDSTFCQTRFLSTIPEGLEIESNAVMWAACVDGSKDKPGYGVGFVEFVDQDDLYPYRPDQCGRRDMTGAVQFTEIPNLDESGPPIVVLTRWAHIHFRPPSFPMSKEVESAMRTRVLKSEAIAFKVMHERLATVKPDR